MSLRKFRLLQATYDAIAEGRVGTPQQRLAAIAGKPMRDAWMARFSKLHVTKQAEVYLQLQAGADPETLLPHGP